MRALLLTAAAALALTGCKSTPENGFAVDVTVTADSSLPDLSQVRTLDVSVSGAETFHTTYPITSQLAKREAKFVYRPSVSSGTLSFAIYALDGAGASLAYGAGSAALKSGSTTTLTVTLGTANVPSTDMAMCPTACPTLGATQCMGTDVQTCMLIDGCQTWGPAASCGANMLCCADACVAADVSNCYACGTACSGSTPACLPTPMKCGCSVGVCSASSMGCDTATGNCVACTALAANSADFYVDATSFAGGTGDSICPFKTITAALTAANASTAANKKIHVAAGMYAAGETFPLVVRKGISLVGAGAATTTIKGTGLLDHSAAGGQFNETTLQVTILTGDTTGTSTISDFTIANTLAAPMGGYLGVYCDQGNAANTQMMPPPNPLPVPTTVLSGLKIGPNYDLGVVVATTTSPTPVGCNMKMIGNTITGNNNGMWALGCGRSTAAKASVQIQVGDNTAAGSNSFINNKNGAGTGAAFINYDCVSPTFFDMNTIDGGDVGLSWTNHSGTAGGDASLSQPALYEVRNNTIKNLTAAGMVADRGVILDQFTGNTFSGISSGATGVSNAIALHFTLNAQVIKARNNSFVGNDVGVMVDGNAFVAGTRPNFDWGTAADAGNNTFACNSALKAGNVGGDFWFNGVAAGSTVTPALHTNKWDHAPPMMSTTATNGLDIFNSPAVTIDTVGATAAGITCPAGHIP